MTEGATTQTGLLRFTEGARKFIPFILLSLLLHVAALWFISLLTENARFIRPHSMEVHFSTTSVSKYADTLDAVSTGESHVPADLSLRKTQKFQHGARPAEIFSDGNLKKGNRQQLLESAKNMARDAAKADEQHIAAQTIIQLATPVGLLEQYLKRPHKEIRLANGMLKIVTDAGELCFQPAPYFARESAGVFGMPISCP